MLIQTISTRSRHRQSAEVAGWTRLGASALVLSAIFAASAWACKYTVRDVAYVDLGDAPYRLYLYVGDEDGDADALAEVARESFAESNIEFQVVRVGEDPGDRRLAFLHKAGARELPAAVLVAPDDRLRRIDWPETDVDGDLAAVGAEAFREAIMPIIRSPLTREALEKCLAVHSVVLIVEGRDDRQNARAAKMVDEAVARIARTLSELPKPIENPPVVIRVPSDEVQRESTLLWSLGAQLDADRPTQIAMLFGRGRRLGPVLDASEIETDDVLRSMAIVGLDCECELDRSWMRAAMIPHAWTPADETEAAERLGFDPGHPLVRVEMSRIVNRGPNSGGGPARRDLSDVDALLPGLQMIDLDFAVDETPGVGEAPPADRSPSADVAAADEVAGASSPELSTAADSAVKLPAAPPREAATSQSPANARRAPSPLRTISAALLGLAALGALGGALVIALGKRGLP